MSQGPDGWGRPEQGPSSWPTYDSQQGGAWSGEQARGPEFAAPPGPAYQAPQQQPYPQQPYPGPYPGPNGPGGPAGAGPNGPGGYPPRGSGTSPVAIVVVALVAIALVGTLVATAAIYLSRPRGEGPVPSPVPSATSARPSSSAPSRTPRPSRPPSSIEPAPPGQPPSGDVKVRLDQAYGSFEPIRRSGTGNAEIELPANAGRGVIWAKAGNQWFSVEGTDKTGQETPLFYSGEGYEGVVGYGLDLRDDDENLTRLRIESRNNGSWEIEIRPVSSSPMLTGPASGTGHQVLIHDGAGADWVATQNGTSNFFLQEYGANDVEYHINEIGNAEKKVRLIDGLTVLQVESWHQGQWGLRPA